VNEKQEAEFTALFNMLRDGQSQSRKNDQLTQARLAVLMEAVRLLLPASAKPNPEKVEVALRKLDKLQRVTRCVTSSNLAPMRRVRAHHRAADLN
jgi:hypothetical protein